MARFSGLTRGLSNDRHPKLGTAQLPASVVTASSKYAFGTDTVGNMAIGAALGALVPGNPVSSNAGYNTAVGRNALTSLTHGSFNTALGDEALQNFTTSDYVGEHTGGANVAVGQQALSNLVDGYWNTAIGRTAMNASVHDWGNTAAGWAALASLNSASGTAIENTALGLEAMNNATTGSANTAVGAEAMSNGSGVPGPMGSFNTGVGYQSMLNMTNGGNSYNSSLGAQSLTALTTGTHNAIVGAASGNNIITGGHNVVIGNSAGPTGDFSWSICIGHGTSASNWGGVAIGTDSGGGSATAAQDVFALGTATHKVKVSNNATGAGSAALGANSPAVTNTAPYTWFRMMSSDGSTVYVPAWK